MGKKVTRRPTESLETRLAARAEKESICWAKVKGHSWWPAQVVPEDVIVQPTTSTRRKGVPVVFFGTLEHAWVADNMIKNWGEGLASGFTEKTRAIQPAVDQANAYLLKYKTPAGWWTRFHKKPFKAHAAETMGSQKLGHCVTHSTTQLPTNVKATRKRIREGPAGMSMLDKSSEDMPTKGVKRHATRSTYMKERSDEEQICAEGTSDRVHDGSTKGKQLATCCDEKVAVSPRCADATTLDGDEQLVVTGCRGNTDMLDVAEPYRGQMNACCEDGNTGGSSTARLEHPLVSSSGAALEKIKQMDAGLSSCQDLAVASGSAPGRKSLSEGELPEDDVQCAGELRSISRLPSVCVDGVHSRKLPNNVLFKMPCTQMHSADGSVAQPKVAVIGEAKPIFQSVSLAMPLIPSTNALPVAASTEQPSTATASTLILFPSSDDKEEPVHQSHKVLSNDLIHAGQNGVSNVDQEAISYVGPKRQCTVSSSGQDAMRETEVQEKMKSPEMADLNNTSEDAVCIGLNSTAEPEASGDTCGARRTPDVKVICTDCAIPGSLGDKQLVDINCHADSMGAQSLHPVGLKLKSKQVDQLVHTCQPDYDVGAILVHEMPIGNDEACGVQPCDKVQYHELVQDSMNPLLESERHLHSQEPWGAGALEEDEDNVRVLVSCQQDASSAIRVRIVVQGKPCLLNGGECQHIAESEAIYVKQYPLNDGPPAVSNWIDDKSSGPVQRCPGGMQQCSSLLVQHAAQAGVGGEAALEGGHSIHEQYDSVDACAKTSDTPYVGALQDWKNDFKSTLLAAKSLHKGSSHQNEIIDVGLDDKVLSRQGEGEHQRAGRAKDTLAFSQASTMDIQNALAQISRGQNDETKGEQLVFNPIDDDTIPQDKESGKRTRQMPQLSIIKSKRGPMLREWPPGLRPEGLPEESFEKDNDASNDDSQPVTLQDLLSTVYWHEKEQKKKR